ncbi:U-scoloptoxin(01)-Er1a [Lucilia cuprina]|uniref:U-scoloptoxin(01)-Er1a n=1 Tax=Lucilia cuprina TaxID=7375 RepID=UPI001F0660D9|nr:U-scoloptoxin(01)-Er1a [Lucilia cuprina]XP_046809241.1 U-scoloptoxin(01)-Er1a [Lucilia cuprina]XP_046809242.1 U-scoloptoxin(01)-Er1a [Lucilia cuprina]XP_046809243.1 U-scoloptoxin(01)-Er1a [Lucilia cuprina]
MVHNNSSSSSNNTNNNNTQYSTSSLKQNKIMQRKHLRLLQLPQIVAATVIFVLLFNCICVSGQIDGYEAGVDYPIYDAVPKGLSFNCQGRLPGYYADTETRCQVWHWCLHSGHQYSFLCPNGTVFNQAVRVCDWWSNVNCPAAEQLYENNDELYRTTEINQFGNDDNSI